MPNSIDDDLISDIYEAAAVPELWPDVLHRLSNSVGGVGGLLFTASENSFRWTSSPDIRDLFDEFVRCGLAAINPRPKRLSGLNHAGFVRDHDAFTDEEMDADPVYQFYRKNGVGWATGTMIPVPSGDSIVFSFENAYKSGPFTDEVVAMFDGLRPHLARGALLSARLGLARAQAMADALETVGLPAAVLRLRGRLLAANSSFSNFVPSVFQDRQDRVHLADDSADFLLADAIERVSTASALAPVNSIPLPAEESRPPLILHLMPVCGAAQDIFSNAISLLVVTPVDRAIVPTATVLQGLFDLTPAEARVARGIGEGETIEALATRYNLARETVRTQLKAVLGKTGMHRQSDLVSMLASASLRRESGE